MDVLPIEVGDDLEEGAEEALVETVDEDDAGDEAAAELRTQHAQPPDGLSEERRSAAVGRRRRDGGGGDGHWGCGQY